MVSEKVLMWKDLAEKWGKQTGVPKELILAVIQMESGGNPNAHRPEMLYLKSYGGSPKFKQIEQATKLSPIQIATSYGLMQLMIPTAWGYMSLSDKNVDCISNILVPSSNVRYGASHLGTLYKKHKTIYETAKHYNGTGADAERYGRNTEALYKEYENYFRRQ